MNDEHREGFSAPYMKEALVANDEEHGAIWRLLAVGFFIAAACSLVLALLLML